VKYIYNQRKKIQHLSISLSFGSSLVHCNIKEERTFRIPLPFPQCLSQRKRVIEKVYTERRKQYAKRYELLIYGHSMHTTHTNSINIRINGSHRRCVTGPISHSLLFFLHLNPCCICSISFLFVFHSLSPSLFRIHNECLCMPNSIFQLLSV